MKHLGLALLVVAIMTSVGAQTEDVATEPSIKLQMSKTLTLNPTGKAPTNVLAKPPSNETPSSEPKTVETTAKSDSPSGRAIGWWMLALLALPAMFWLGTRQSTHKVQAAQHAEQHLVEQVEVLKEAVIESGSGPRNEWQSTLTTLQAELREKSRYIDQLHDKTASSSEQLGEFEAIVSQQNDALTQLEEAHAKALDEQAKRLNEQLSAQAAQAETQLEQQPSEAQSLFDSTTLALKEQLEQQSAESEKRLEQEVSEVEARLKKQLDTAEQSVEELANKLTAAQTSYEQAEQHGSALEEELNALKIQHERLSTELDATQVELAPAAEQVKSLTDDIERLSTSNDERASTIDALKQDLIQRDEQIAEISERLTSEVNAAKAEFNTTSEEQQLDFESKFDELKKASEVTQKQAEDENTKLQRALEDAQTSAEQRLSAQKSELEEAFEAEQQRVSAQHNQQIEELHAAVTKLERVLGERDTRIKEIEADFAFSSETAQSALDERDVDLEALTAKLALFEANEIALASMKADSETLAAQMEDKQRHVETLEQALKESTAKIDHLSQSNKQLKLNEAELAQMQSIIVDTENALSDARKELQNQSKQLNQQSLKATQAAAEQESSEKEIARLKAELESVTEQAKQENQRTKLFEDEQQEIQQLVREKDQELQRLRDTVESLEDEHGRQSNLITSLESTVVQLESDLILRESENTETLKLLATVNDQSSDLAAKAKDTELLDTHIAELEAQLRKEQGEREHIDARLTETTTNQMQLMEQQQHRAVELEKELEALKISYASESQANEHLRKTLDQARKYREELEENTRDLERENRELSQSSTKTRQELEVSNQALQQSGQKISERDQKLQELQKELDRKSSELKSSQTELHSMFDKVDELSAAVAQNDSDLSRNDDAANLQAQLESNRAELSKRTQQLKVATATREEIERNATALKEQLQRAQTQLEQHDHRNTTLGAQVVELNQQREEHLETIHSLQEQIDAMPTPSLNNGTLAHEQQHRETSPDQDYNEAMRARENIIAALEEELSRADITIAGLRQKLDDVSVAESAEQRIDPNGQNRASEAELDKLKLALLNKSRRVQELSNEVKVSQDLVKVFENDSNMLHDTEVKLESQEEHNQFLEHELAKAVTENKTLKNELDKAAKRLARHQNIGRTVSENTRLAQLKSRLSLLENENKEQLEVIAKLRNKRPETN